MTDYEILSERQEKVLRYLEAHGIPFTTYNHPEGKTIEQAKQWWHNDGSMHCKNIFMRFGDSRHRTLAQRGAGGARQERPGQTLIRFTGTDDAVLGFGTGQREPVRTD